jgi:SAM-dependent methyltransferase
MLSTTMTMFTDPWLSRWLPLIAQATNGGPLLEIGCGSGADTSELMRNGLHVVAFDLSPEAVQAAKRAAPSASITVQSVTDPFPLEGTGLGAVIASLSLHYFTWAQTISMAARIHSTLKPGGLFLCRLNSSEDKNFGSIGNPEIEPGLYLVNGQPKRFFSKADVEKMFFQGWKQLSCEQTSSRKYGLQKHMWEVAVRRDV